MMQGFTNLKCTILNFCISVPLSSDIVTARVEIKAGREKMKELEKYLKAE